MVSNGIIFIQWNMTENKHRIQISMQTRITIPIDKQDSSIELAKLYAHSFFSINFFILMNLQALSL